MFGISGLELGIVALFVLLVFGPDKLPELARTVGRFMGDFRKYQQMMESSIKAEMFDLDTKKVDTLSGKASPTTGTMAVGAAATAATDEDDEEEEEE